ncbi:RNA polymerase sigma factor [Microbulbifer rhizosphaerae]|uniref:RNA polymerase sigma-70 factor (ECF subfamily) n=1 Tax=Microbulbifer rhizosphaerae TaxID=1562603 RepID=A0A7W4Z7W2_9GAMM|nr:RNA polymerase sigma factor [Microbulbifer rhizosphaerae]MBB3059906.1 RNA polymerase sigma-70 factor (ECF subfamily) [Microbulbifer rhizosphaerae]
MTFTRSELDALFRYCLALIGQAEDAQDLLHSALERFLRSRPADVQQPLAYIRRIARNRFFDQMRRAGRVQFDSLEDVDAQPGTERDLESLLVDEMTLRQWRDLNAAEREVVFLWAVEGLSSGEIALQLGQPRGTVLARLHRLRRRLLQRFPQPAGGIVHD